MNEPNKPNHWQSLASELGAEVPPEVPPKDGDSSPGGPDGVSVADEAPPAPRRENKARATKRTPQTNWNDLAEGLGVASSAPADDGSEVVMGELVVGDPPDAAEEPEPVGSFEKIEPDKVDFGDTELSSTEPVDLVSPDDAPGKGQEDGNTDSERRPRRRRRRRGRRGRQEDKAAPEASTEATAVAEDDTAAGDSEAKVNGEDDPEGGGRARRPRRRRRRSSRSGSDQQDPPSEELESDKEELESDEFDDLIVDDGDQPAASGTSQDAAQEESSVGGNNHRKIPSWEDAVGAMISGNIESRGKSGRGGSKGRGGGRRGGGKS